MDPEETRIAFVLGALALTFGAVGIGASVASLIVALAGERRQPPIRREKARMEADAGRIGAELRTIAAPAPCTPVEPASGPIPGALHAASAELVAAPAVAAVRDSDAHAGRQAVPATPAPVSYPEPEIVIPPDAALAKLPSAEDLPPISGTDVPWAWTDAEFRRGRTVVAPSGESGIAAGGPVFVLGDLHGDAESLRRILAHVYAASENSRIVFLGDLVDRADGPETLECARLLMWAANAHPGRVLWIRGNHDCLYWNEEKVAFSSKTSPHDFADFLGANPEFESEGRALASIMAKLPVAAVSGNVLMSHGGVLQDDQAGIRSFTGLSSLADEQCSDFVWSRMRDVPHKIASRISKGAEVGFRQAVKFAARLRETDGLEIGHIVCGHQHESKDGFGYLAFERHFSIGITCQCVTSFLNRDAPRIPARPAILRLDGDNTPVPVFFPFQD